MSAGKSRRRKVRAPKLTLADKQRPHGHESEVASITANDPRRYDLRLEPFIDCLVDLWVADMLRAAKKPR